MEANTTSHCHWQLMITPFFQVISHCQRKPHRDIHRFEKISNIIKQFKLSCSKLAASFQSMEVRNATFAAFIDIFTSNTYVMVIMSDPTIRKYSLTFLFGVGGWLIQNTPFKKNPRHVVFSIIFSIA
jgi:hypothetical protein